jgi:hypothetical protein
MSDISKDFKSLSCGVADRMVRLFLDPACRGDQFSWHTFPDDVVEEVAVQWSNRYASPAKARSAESFVFTQGRETVLQACSEVMMKYGVVESLESPLISKTKQKGRA